MIPEDKKAGVERALQDSFGASEFEDICRITRGLSSDLVFRIVVKGSPYVLRIMTKVDERNDPARIYACLKTAADAGIAPRMWYFSTDDGITIIDFVESVPFPERQAVALVPNVLRRLHALPLFPKAFNYVTAHKGFIWRFRMAGLVPQDEVEEVFRRYEEICAVYPRMDADMVSCHMDLKPENILFDGQRAWLIDWMAAAVNDRYFDLAIVANFVVGDEVDEIAYLERYFGQKPDEYERARFFLMKQVLHMFYATVFLLLEAGGKPIGEREELPTFGDFHRQIWGGEVDLADNGRKVIYGMVHWKQLLRNLRVTRFDEALGIVKERNKSQESLELLLPRPT